MTQRLKAGMLIRFTWDSSDKTLAIVVEVEDPDEYSSEEEIANFEPGSFRMAYRDEDGDTYLLSMSEYECIKEDRIEIISPNVWDIITSLVNA